MELGQATYEGSTFSVLMDEKIYEIMLGGMPRTTARRTGRADEIAQKVAKWVKTGEPFTYPIHERGTPFQQKVYKVTQAIPKGKVTTYRAVAEKVGTKAYRAVGQALGANPVCLLTPCHRVVGSDRTLTGFGGGIGLKQKILESEGVKFENGKVKKEYVIEKL